MGAFAYIRFVFQNQAAVIGPAISIIQRMAGIGVGCRRLTNISHGSIGDGANGQVSVPFPRCREMDTTVPDHVLTERKGSFSTVHRPIEILLIAFVWGG
ncbi:hypothetical protein CW358_21510 [Pseudomonas protegens]|nr:hypothetical protein CW358_21510 [Pseudomonas protegens]